MTPGRSDAGFRHELLEYRGLSQGTQMVGGLIDQACRDGAPVFVAAPPIQLDALRRRPSLANGSSSHDQVRFVALEGPLLNPALLAQALVDFVDAHPEGPAPVGIGEATHAGRGAEALLECALHDSAFGRLFAHGRPWNLTCPIDIGALPSAAVDRVRRMHGPDGSDEAATTRAAKLTEPDPPPPTCAFDADSAREARSWAVGRGRDEGLTGSSLESLEIVAGELTVNSVIHGGGSGTIRLWSTPDSVVCEVTDNGRLDDPLAGRTRPEPLQIGGRGLWIVNQFCKLVQVRNLKEGTVVRAHLARSADGAG